MLKIKYCYLLLLPLNIITILIKSHNKIKMKLYIQYININLLYQQNV